MKQYHNLYPPRSRKTNIELIQNVINADSQEAHDRALGQFVDKLHPSLYAELDWMERSVSENERQNAIKLIDILFLTLLERIIESRKIEFEINDSELFDEILENHDFYRLVLETYPEIADAFGTSLGQRIKELYHATSGAQVFKNPERHDYKAAQVQARLAFVTDRETLPLLISELVFNETAAALDHISSRIRAKAFIRDMGDEFPQLRVGALKNKRHVQELKDQLVNMQEKAKEFRLLSLQKCVAAILQFVEKTDILSLNQFEGELANGSGLCGECSMMFSSSVIISLDTTCPFLFEGGPDRRINLPLSFNVAQCPFCGSIKRVEAPSMFYRPDDKKVIYCIPTMGQYSNEEAEEIYGAVIRDLREHYQSRIDPVSAKAFDSAAEEVTYSMAEFIIAIQMGTTNKVWHAFNVVTLASGRAVLVDKTTGTMIDLISPSEIHQMWNLDENSSDNEALKDQYARAEESIQNAMIAYSDGDYSKSCEILEEQYKLDPQNNLVKQHLASAYLRMNKKESAAAILESQ